VWNFGHGAITSHYYSAYYAGYTIAHEFLHQLLALASFYREGTMYKFGHDNSSLNLNMDGLNPNFITPSKLSASHK